MDKKSRSFKEAWLTYKAINSGKYQPKKLPPILRGLDAVNSNHQIDSLERSYKLASLTECISLIFGRVTSITSIDRYLYLHQGFISSNLQNKNSFEEPLHFDNSLSINFNEICLEFLSTLFSHTRNFTISKNLSISV